MEWESPLSDLAGLPCVMRGTASQLLLRTEIPFRLSLPSDQPFSRPERAFVRTLSDCPPIPVGATGERDSFPQDRTRLVSVSRARASSPNVSRPRDHTRPFRLPMSSHALCIAALLKRIVSTIPTVGAAILPGVKHGGRSSLHGSGLGDWNWAMLCTLIPDVPRKVPLPR
jgi:hypothetical protein